MSATSDTAIVADNKARALRLIERQIDEELDKLLTILEFQYEVTILHASRTFNKPSPEEYDNKKTRIFNSLWQMQSAVADCIETYMEIYHAHSAWDTTAFPPPDLQPKKGAGALRRAIPVGPKKQKKAMPVGPSPKKQKKN